MGLPRRTTRIWPLHYRARIAVALSRMCRAGVARKVLALMIHLSLAIYCAESSLAAPTYSVLTGTATEALPDNPGQVSVTLSEIYQPPEGYEVRYNVSDRAKDDPNSASVIAPGETQLTDAAFTGTAYVKLYLVRSSDGLVVQQTPLPPIDFAEDTGQTPRAPRLTDVIASANGATAARATVTTDAGSGLLYWVATTSDTVPSASNVVAAQDHAGAAASSFGSVPVEVKGTVKVAVSDLAPGETYYLHFAQRDSEGAVSAVASSASVTPIATVIEDLTNPTVENIFDDAPLRTAWQGVTLDDYAADNGATITDVSITYRLGGESVENGDVLGNADDVLTIAVDVTASDKTEAHFVYGPATISEAPVVDSTPPVLSDFALSASGPASARGSVTTSEGGGSLHWIGTDSSTSSPEGAFHAQFETDDLSSAGLAGSIPIPEPGVIPIEFTGLAPETDYTFYCCHTDAAGNRSNIVKASARTLPSENLTLTIEDFSRDKVPFHSKRVEGTTGRASKETTTKESVMALAEDSTVGSQHKGDYKIPGKDALPAGLSISGNRIDVSGSFTGWLEGWDFTGYMLSWRDGEIRIRNSIFGERNGPVGLNAYIDIYPHATLVELINNDFLGPNRYGGAGLAIKYRTAGSDNSATGPIMAPGRVARNRFYGLSSDALKPTGGIIEENVILYENNLDGPAHTWSSNQSYAKGQLARNEGGNVFRSKSDRNNGNPVPSRKSDTAYWENLDPHCDAITPVAVTDLMMIRANYINMDASLEQSVGMNNAIRSVPNSGSILPHKKVDVANNVLIGATGGNSKLIQAVDGGNPNHIPDRFYNNWIEARSESSILHPDVTPNTVWENNRDLQTDAIISGTSHTITDPSLADIYTTPTPTYIAKVARNGKASAGYSIEARAVPEGGAKPTEWTEIATADSKGNWNGVLEVPRGPNPYHFEVRLKDAHSISAKTTRTFVSGVVIAMHTQSDIASPTLRTRAPWVTIEPEPLLKENVVQMFYLEGFDMDAPEQPEANLRRVFLSDETPYSPGMAAIANTFIDLMPDTPVALIMHTVSGTSPTEMASDGNPGRVWENDKKLHDFATRDGNQPGLHASYFSSSYKGISKRFGEALAPIFTGYYLDGTSFKTPGRHEYGWNQNIWIDHTYTDLYNLKFTKTMILPIDSIEEEESLYHFVDTFPHLLRVGKFDLYNSSVSGRYNESQNRVDDTNHANSHKEWGGPRRMRMWALSMIEALGEQPLEQPVLDIVEAAPNGDAGMVRIGSTSGPISTIRKQLGLPELKSSKHAAYGDGVYGIYVNGTYVDAYIGDDAGKPAKEGWIYVPRPSGSFRDSDIIGTQSVGFARSQGHMPLSGNPGKVDYYLDDALLSKPVVPSDIYHIWGLHAIMPRKAGDIFHYSDIVSGKWVVTAPPSQEPDQGDQTPDQGDQGDQTPDQGDEGGNSEPSGMAGYTADFSTDLSSSPLLTTSSNAFARYKPNASHTFPQNGSLNSALELTGNEYWEVSFTFIPDILLEESQAFEVDLAAYASSVLGENSDMAIRIYCDYDGGSDLLMQIREYVGADPGQIIADLKNQRFSCNGPNGKPRLEFLIDNPRNDKRRISLMQLAVRSL